MKNEPKNKHQMRTSPRSGPKQGAGVEDRAPNTGTYSLEECMRFAKQDYDAQVSYAVVLLAYLDGVRTSD